MPATPQTLTDPSAAKTPRTWQPIGPPIPEDAGPWIPPPTKGPATKEDREAHEAADRKAGHEWAADLRRFEQDRLTGLAQVGLDYLAERPDRPVTPQSVAAGFAFVNGDSLRFDKTRGWMEYDRGRWALARSVRSSLGAFIAGAYAKTPKVVEKVSREVGKILPEAEEVLAMDPAHEWDGKADLLGLPVGSAGVSLGAVHLPTGETVLPGPGAGITKAAGCLPGDVGSDLWARVVLESCGGDETMADALQVALGSAAFGHNRDHLAHVAYGEGENGKSLILETVAAAFGGYAGTVSASILNGRGDRHATFLASLQGLRFGLVTEMGGAALRAETFKGITAGNRQQANYMRRDTFYFTPVVTLWIETNDLPALRTVDRALRRRIRVWPFDHAPARPDPELAAKLQSPAHLGGVLRWLLVGAETYALNGAGAMECDRMRDATDHYFQIQDTIGEWARAHVTAATGEGWEATALLYRSYTQWTDTEQQRPASAAAFATWLSRRYEPVRTNKQRGFAVLLDDGEPASE